MKSHLYFFLIYPKPDLISLNANHICLSVPNLLQNKTFQNVGYKFTFFKAGVPWEANSPAPLSASQLYDNAWSAAKELKCCFPSSVVEPLLRSPRFAFSYQFSRFRIIGHFCANNLPPNTRIRREPVLFCRNDYHTGPCLFASFR